MKRGDRVRDAKTGLEGRLVTFQQSKWTPRTLCLVQLDGNDLPVNPVVRWYDEIEPVEKAKT